MQEIKGEGYETGMSDPVTVTRFAVMYFSSGSGLGKWTLMARGPDREPVEAFYKVLVRTFGRNRVQFLETKEIEVEGE